MKFELLENVSSHKALVSVNETVAYDELKSRGEELAAMIPGRSLILNMATNVPEFVVGYTGFLRSGSVQLLVSDAIAPESLENLISVYSPAYAFVPESITIQGKVKRVCRGYKLVVMENVKTYDMHPDLALLLSTSGTTGSPKMVRLCYKNIQSNTASIIQYLGIGPEECTITTMPLSYSYGLSILNTHLLAGATVVMTEASVMSREFWNLLRDKAVTSFGGVPYFFEMLKKLKFERMELPSLRYFTQAGGKLSTELAAEFTKVCLQKKIRFYIMYGQTEATARISYFCATDHPEKVGSIGRPIPGGELWRENESGERITSPGETGELVYRGANVSMGFAESYRDLALGDINLGTLKTGDLAIEDQDGFYSVVGRKNRFLKIFGLRINLLHLEEVLGSKGFECACVGTDQQLFIYFTKGEDRDRLDAAIVALTGIYKSGFRLIHIEAIPRTSSGKVHYKALESLG